MTPSTETVITAEDKETIIESLGDKQSEIDKAFRSNIKTMDTKELVSLHRIVGGTYIYGATEQAIYDTATAIVIPSKVKRYCAEELRNRRPLNRAERRIMISQARREERQEARRLHRQRGL